MWDIWIICKSRANMCLQYFAQLSWIRVEQKQWRVSPPWTDTGMLRVGMHALLLDISRRCWDMMLMEMLCDLPGQTRESTAVHSIRGKEPCLLTFSSEVWHIKDLKGPKLYEGSVTWMSWMSSGCSSKGSHLQSYMASLLWCHCLNNLLTGMYWHELSTRLQCTVNSELFLLLMRGFLCVLICLFYGF